MNNRIFIKNFIVLQFLNLLVKPLWILLVDRMFQNLLGEQVYGNYAVMLNTCLIFMLLLDFGINNWNSKSVAKNQVVDNSIFTSLLVLKVILSIIFLGIILFIGNLQSLNLNFLLLIGITQISMSFNLYFRSNYQGLQYFVMDSIVSVSDKLLAIIAGSGVLFFMKGYTNITVFICIQLTSTFLVNVVCFYINFKHKITFNFTKLSLMPLVIQCLPYAILVGLMTVYTKLDIIFLKNIAPNGDVACGIYAQSNRILDALNIFLALIATQLLPHFSKNINDKLQTTKVLNLSIKILLLPIIYIIIIALYFALPIIQILYTSNETSKIIISSQCFKWMMATSLPLGLIYVFGTLLTAQGKLKFLIFLSFSTIVFNVVISAILVPLYYEVGSAFCTFATQLFFALGCLLYATMLNNIKINVIFLAKILGISLITIVSAYFLLNFQIHLYIKFAIISLIMSVLCIVINYFEFNTIRQILFNGK